MLIQLTSRKDDQPLYIESNVITHVIPNQIEDEPLFTIVRSGNGRSDVVVLETPKEIYAAIQNTLTDDTIMMREALEYGQGLGCYANALLWNAGGVIREYAEKSGRDHLRIMADQLQVKAKCEFAALKRKK